MLYFITKNFSAINIKLTNEVLSLVLSKIKDTIIDLATNVKTIKKFCLKLLIQYHKKDWRAEYIFCQKLVDLEHLDCENIRDYISKLCKISQHVANMR